MQYHQVESLFTHVVKYHIHRSSNFNFHISLLCGLKFPRITYVRNHSLDSVQFIHDNYRSADGTSLQVSATFSFADRTIHMSCIFRVVSRAQVPNQRIGIILGQHTLIDHMIYTAISRSFLVHKEPQIEKNV